MYKVFFNDSCLLLSDRAVEEMKNIPYHFTSQIDEAMHLMANSNQSVINLYSDDLEELWFDFQNHFKIVEAAGGIVKNNQDEILFIYRLGKWDLPKGKMEEGESKEATAIREIEEECKIDKLSLDEFITTTYHIYFQKEYILKKTHWFHVTHDGNDVPQPQTEEGIEKVEWFKAFEVKELLKNSYSNIKMLFEIYHNSKSNYNE